MCGTFKKNFGNFGLFKSSEYLGEKNRKRQEKIEEITGKN